MTELIDKKESYFGFDLLKFVVAILIIYLHINFFPKDGWLYYITKALGNLGVPCFFIISGFFFFKKILSSSEEKHFSIYLNYIKRLAILLLFWGVIYFVCIDIWWIIDGNVFTNILEYLRHVLFGGDYFFLWYIVSSIFGVSFAFLFYKLMGKYMFIPAAILFIVGSLCSSYSFLFDNTFIADVIKTYNKIFNNTRNGLFFAFPCMSLGLLILFFKRQLEDNVLLRVIPCIVFIGLLVFEMVLRKIKNGTIISPLSLSVVLASFGLTLVFFAWRGEYKYSFALRKLSFLIYVIHPLLLRLIDKLLTVEFIMSANIDYYWYKLYYLNVPILAFVSIGLGLILILLSKKVKFLKKVM